MMEYTGLEVGSYADEETLTVIPGKTWPVHSFKFYITGEGVSWTVNCGLQGLVDKWKRATHVNLGVPLHNCGYTRTPGVYNHW